MSFAPRDAGLELKEEADMDALPTDDANTPSATVVAVELEAAAAAVAAEAAHATAQELGASSEGANGWVHDAPQQNGRAGGDGDGGSSVASEGDGSGSGGYEHMGYAAHFEEDYGEDEDAEGGGHRGYSNMYAGYGQPLEEGDEQDGDDDDNDGPEEHEEKVGDEEPEDGGDFGDFHSARPGEPSSRPHVADKRLALLEAEYAATVSATSSNDEHVLNERIHANAAAVAAMTDPDAEESDAVVEPAKVEYPQRSISPVTDAQAEEIRNIMAGFTLNRVPAWVNTLNVDALVQASTAGGRGSGVRAAAASRRHKK